MSDDVMIRVEGLGKRYRIHHEARERYTALRDVIARGAGQLLRRRSASERAHDEEFWALKDVSFEVKRGEVVGVIGRNGAGKSTLLKILSRITEPTEGRIELNGRVSSLLEVGTGFHPELTGRENIFLNGSILGMSRREVARKFDEIVAFAEVERFLDTPVKRYSSGMYMRLAFAVAAHMEPEILIVDEVLAVGDAEFQKKCLGKMGEVSRQGRTVLFVSHNMSSIASLCSVGILLDRGASRPASPISEAISNYTRASGLGGPPELGLMYHKEERAPSSLPTILRVDMYDHHDQGASVVESLRSATFRMAVRMTGQESKLSAIFVIRDKLGSVVAKFESNPNIFPLGNNSECVVSSLPLVPGEYFLSVALAEFGSHIIESRQDVATFSVTNTREPFADMGPHSEGYLAARHAWRRPVDRGLKRANSGAMNDRQLSGPV